MKKWMKNNFVLRSIVLVWKSSPFHTTALLILASLSGLLAPAVLYINKQIIDESAAILRTGYVYLGKEMLIWLISLGLIQLLDYVMAQLTAYMQNIQTQYISLYLDKIVLQKLIHIDIKNFDDVNTYNDIEQINKNSLANIQSILNSGVSFIRLISSIVSIIIVVFLFSPIVLALCIFSTIPLVLTNLFVLIKQYEIYAGRIEKTRFVLFLKNLFFQYNSLQEIKIFRIGSYLLDKIIFTNEKHLTEDKKYNRKFIGIFSATELARVTLSLGNVALIIYFSVKKKLSIGSLTMYINSVKNLEAYTKELVETITFLYNNNLYLSSLFRILDYETEKNQNVDQILLKPEKYSFESLEFIDVSFKYINSKDYILKHINLKIEAEKNYALVGLNGSGKTTLVKLITGLYQPTEGRILVNGTDVNELPRDFLFHIAGAIFQDFTKYPLSVHENIGLGNLRNMNDIFRIKDAAKKANAADFIDTLQSKYETLLLREWTDGIDLSGGQWQKIALSRAFLSDSPFLILDEPTSSMDAKAEFEIFNQFRLIMKGKTCLLISHKFSTVKLSDEIFVMDKGKLVECGKHEDLIQAGGLYSELYHLQMKLYGI